MSSLYRGNEKNFHPEFVAFNETDSTIRLFIKLLPSEFLFARHSDEKFRASVRINSELMRSYEDATIINSSSQLFSFELSDKENTKLINVSVPAPDSGEYVIRCTIIDTTKDYHEYFLIAVDRASQPSRQDFLVTDMTGAPVFRNYLSALDSVNIRYKNENVNEFFCKVYHRDFPLAAPPFSFDMHDDFNYKPDSSFRISKGELSKLNFPQQGFYHFQLDSSSKNGLTLFRYSNGFPEVSNTRQMIESARYLTNRKEYEEFIASPNPKPLIDNFWLTHGGNEEKTRLLIKKYYGRVRDANKFFSSHTEGWRTDRGMIYVIFGSPGTVYRSNESESWTYGTPNSSLSLNFFFVKVNNPFTNNDFMLSRSPTYESAWYRAVEVWRQGRAYNSMY